MLPWVGSCPALHMLTSTAFHVFRTHEPRIRIDDLSDSPAMFVARVSVSVATTEGCTSRGSIYRAAETDFDSSVPIPIEGGTGSTEALAAATPMVQPTNLSRSSSHQTAPAAPAGSTVSVSALLGTPAPPSSSTRRRTATATGNAPRSYIMDSGQGGCLGHLPDEVQPRRESHGKAGSARRRDPCSCRLAGSHGATTVQPRPRRAYMNLHGNSTLTAHASSW